MYAVISKRTTSIFTRPSLVAVILVISWILYTLWVLGTPFIDAEQPILRYIPSPFAFGVGVPLFVAAAFGSLVVVTLGVLLIISP